MTPIARKLTVLRVSATHAHRKIGRVEELALRRGADPVHGAGADKVAATKFIGDTLQEGVADTDIERRGSHHDGGELDVT
jgi:hypothetical protein